MSARNRTGVLRYSSMIRWNSTRLPPAWVWMGAPIARAASLPARRSGSLQVSTWAALKSARRRPWAAPSNLRTKSTASCSAPGPRGVLLVGEPPLRVHVGVAVAERGSPVDPHPEVVHEARVAFPVPAQAAHVDHGGGAVLERVQEHEGAEGRGGLRGRRGHLALERRRERHVVGGAVVVLGHVEQEVVAPGPRGVHVGVDEARRDQLAPRGDARVGRPRVGPARVHDPVALEDDGALLVHLVAAPAPRHHPAALDRRPHARPPEAAC